MLRPPAWKIRTLKENSPRDERLQALKEKIRAQRKACLPCVPEEKRTVLGSVGKPRCKKHPKRKVCKPSSSSAPASPAANSFGSSAWREGQKLARKILGPPPKYPKQREQHFGENNQTEKTKREIPAGQLNKEAQDGWIERWSRRVQKAADTEKRTSNQPRSTESAGDAGSKRGYSHQLKTSDSPDAEMMDARETASDGNGKLNKSSLRGDSSSRKENQPADWLTGHRNRPYSPRQVREFMSQKVAERNKRIQEEKRSLKQAHEEKKKKLQDIYRKQREAVSGKRCCVMAQQLGGDGTSLVSAKNDLGLKYADRPHPGTDDTEWVQRASQALLRDEAEFGRGPEGHRINPLKLKDLDTSSPLASPYSQSSFLLWKRPAVGMEIPLLPDTLAFSSYQRKQERIRAIHDLARDLSQRLGREMEQFQVTKKTKASSHHRCPSEAPASSKRSSMTTPPGPPLEESGATETAEAVWGPRASPRLLTSSQKRGGRAWLGEGSVALFAKERIGQPSAGDGSEVLRIDSGPSSEERQEQDTGEARGLNDADQGCALKAAALEKGPLEWGNGDSSVSPGQGLPGSPSVGFLAGAPDASHHKDARPEDEGQKTHLQQPRASDLPSWSVPLLRRKTTSAGDLAKHADGNSQWSEISQFYGGSRSFSSFGLAMVEQSLREEELRARHQSALLRLRGKALQEKAEAELAWLDHTERYPGGLQGIGGASSAAKKQLSILTKLKQEQAEIRHLQNIGRAAHQERKLLLQQQKDLLQVQKTTTQLWLQLARKLPHQDAGNLTHPRRAAVFEKESAKMSLKATPAAACPRRLEDRSSHHPLHGGDSNRLSETEEILSQEILVTEEIREWMPEMRDDQPKLLETAMQDLYDSSRDQSPSPSLSGRRSPDHLVSQGEKEHRRGTGWLKDSQDHAAYPLDNGLERLASSSKPPVSCPYLEKSQLLPEFCKARAILVNLSGSSLSPSDFEDDDRQDTDVSLPEEFVVQEQLPDNVSAQHKTPTELQRAINAKKPLSFSEERHHVQASGGHLESDASCALYSQEDRPGGERLDEPASVTLPKSRRLQPPCDPCSKEDLTQTPIFRSKETSLLFCAKDDCGNKMASQSLVEQGMVFSSGRVPFLYPENQRQQDTVPSINATEEDGEYEDMSHLDNRNTSVTLISQVSLKKMHPDIDTPQDSGVLIHGQMHSSPFTSSVSSKHQLVSEGKTSYANCSVNERLSTGPDEVTPQLKKASTVSMDRPKDLPRDKTQNTNESGMPAVQSTSPKVIHPKRCLLKHEDDTVPLNNTILHELEDDILSPVDEDLTYGSTDLPSSTEKIGSSLSRDLPPPPENLSGKDDETISSLFDFPSPPEESVSSEAGELLPPKLLTEDLVSSSPDQADKENFAKAEWREGGIASSAAQVDVGVLTT